MYSGWRDRNESTINTYVGSDYDRDLQAEVCMDRIEERIAQFKEDPAFAVCFFSGRNASQWNDPDFQGWWINTVRKGEGEYPAWMRLVSLEEDDQSAPVNTFSTFTV